MRWTKNWASAAVVAGPDAEAIAIVAVVQI